MPPQPQRHRLRSFLSAVLLVIAAVLAPRIPEIHTHFTVVQGKDIGKVKTAFRLLKALGNWLPFVHFLRTTIRTVLVLGVTVALAAWLGGHGRRATQVHGLWHAGFAATRQAADRIGLQTGPVGPWVHRFKPWLVWCLLGAAALALVLWSYPTGAAVAWLALAAVAGLAVIEFLFDPGPEAQREGPV
ncbi:hypothetical protein [Streptacidiphilus sp. MAP12-20]|uniref:hypothetical protein n=1 Tax=Streptacidiphilus sp. MAP12-20 TaxID=3156299 RepID=UPI003514BD78